MIPPNGDSAAEEFPKRHTFQQGFFFFSRTGNGTLPGKELTSVQTDHPCLQILKHSPHSVHVLRKHVTRQTHTGVVGPFDRLFFRLELVDRRNGTEAFLVRDQHVGRHVCQNGRLKEVASLSSNSIATQDDPGAAFLRVCDLIFGLFETARGGQWTHGCPCCGAMAHDNLGGALLECLDELFVDSGLDVDAVGRDTGLTGVAPFEGHELVQRLVKIGVIKYDEGAIAAQLQGQLLESLRAMARHDFTHSGRSGESHLLDQWVLAERLAQCRSVLQISGEYIQHARGETSFLGKVSEDQSRDWSFGAWFHNHRATSCQGGGSLSENHGDGEVPWHQSDRHADGLLVRDNPATGDGRRRNRSLDPLRLAAEPPRETGRILNLCVGFR